MSKNYAIVQLSPELECARSALDLVLSLASLDQSVQLIMLDNAWMSLQSELHKRYGMLELLDAEPILIASDFEPQLDNDDIEFEWTAKRDLNPLLLNFAEVITCN